LWDGAAEVSSAGSETRTFFCTLAIADVALLQGGRTRLVQ
jgi:hypothetical protein